MPVTHYIHLPIKISLSVNDEAYGKHVPAGEGGVGRHTSPRTFGIEADHRPQLGLIERLRGT